MNLAGAKVSFKNIIVPTVAMSSSDLRHPEIFLDPRTLEGFRAEHWPQYEGAEAPEIGTEDLHEQRCLEFLARHYYLNVANAALVAAHGLGAAEAPAQLAAAVAVPTAQVAIAIQELEKLEDRYAPIGFYAEPTMEGIFYRSLSFLRPIPPKLCPETQSSHSSHLAIPGLKELGISELRGAVTVMRWSHGKMDIQELA